MQVAVLPAHRCLNMPMQFPQRTIPHLNSTPDGRFDVEQRNSELSEDIGTGSLPPAGLRACRLK